jgi:hypothetical protein
MTKPMKSALVSVADLHIVSTFGLCPPKGMRLDGGGRYEPSKFQVGLGKAWSHFWGEFVPYTTRDYRLAAVVINGDVIEGIHHNRTGIVGTTWTEMENAAVELLEPLRDMAEKFFFIRGTEAHAGPMAESEERIAKRLGATKTETGESSHWQARVRPRGSHTLFHFAHHIGVTSSAAYETSAPMREMVTSFIEAAQWEQGLPDVIVRSHRHRFTLVPLPGVMGGIYRRRYAVITPGWQLKTPHVERIDRMRMPHIGGVCFLVEDGECQVKEKLYPLPEPAPIPI